MPPGCAPPRWVAPASAASDRTHARVAGAAADPPKPAPAAKPAAKRASAAKAPAKRARATPAAAEGSDDDAVRSPSWPHAPMIVPIMTCDPMLFCPASGMRLVHDPAVVHG